MVLCFSISTCSLLVYRVGLILRLNCVSRDLLNTLSDSKSFSIDYLEFSM